MAIPPEFNEVEHLQSVVRRYVNRQIREDFQDLGGDNWEPETGTTRGAMRHALTHKDTDPLPVTLSRMFLYYFTYGKAAALQAPIYGMPSIAFQELFRFKPQVRLLFIEEQSLVEDGYEPVQAEVTFRIMDETESTMTPAKAQVLARKIESLFATGKGFTWKKGHEKWTYYDQSKGYQLSILAWNETEAKKIIEQVLDIQGHTPDWAGFLTVSTKKRSFLAVPKTKFIFGKSRREPRDRPVAFVRFRYAELHIWGMFSAITLVDKTGLKKNPLIAA